ncbi:hypothetical protein [Rossellomorea sp. NRS-1567]|uniref:hypothetical protein n=1 Tax=Rossellomorea sp. NRS-1567 TaxID=3233901 RepID=UPI003D2A987D
MELNQVDVYHFLKSKDINHLYHANTVTTSCTFIKQGGLLSRGAVESLGLTQTEQMSDDLDKEFDVWDDIFLDSNDLHKKFRRQNHYGPVLFKFNIDILLYPSLPPLWVTRDNPTRWTAGLSESERYFGSVEALKQDYETGAYKEMITLRNTHDILPFESYLEEIILDNPKILLAKENVLEKAKESLQEAINDSNYDFSEVKKTIRNCNNCFCHENYLNEVHSSKIKSYFYMT